MRMAKNFYMRGLYSGKITWMRIIDKLFNNSNRYFNCTMKSKYVDKSYNIKFITLNRPFYLATCHQSVITLHLSLFQDYQLKLLYTQLIKMIRLIVMTHQNIINLFLRFDSQLKKWVELIFLLKENKIRISCRIRLAYAVISVYSIFSLIFSYPASNLALTLKMKTLKRWYI